MWRPADRATRVRWLFPTRPCRANLCIISTFLLAYVAGAVLRNEPLVRTGGKPHLAEFAFRNGGELVYVDARNRPITAAQYQRLLQRDAAAARLYTSRRRNMQVLVKGRISHADHKTILLRDWHRVAVNTENQSWAMRFVAFID